MQKIQSSYYLLNPMLMQSQVRFHGSKKNSVACGCDRKHSKVKKKGKLATIMLTQHKGSSTNL